MILIWKLNDKKLKIACWYGNTPKGRIKTWKAGVTVYKTLCIGDALRKRKKKTYSVLRLCGFSRMLNENIGGC